MEVIFVPLHVLSFMFIAFNLINIAKIGYSWIQGKKETIDKKGITKYHHGVWAGIILMIITGVLTVVEVKDKVLHPQFEIKMGFVIAILLNTVAFAILLKTPINKKFSSLTQREKLPLYVSGILAFVTWAGAAVSALFILAE